jgi:hypothetical protein
MKYVAYYAPKRQDGEEDPTREFPTEAEAYDYVFEGMCDRCKKDRELALQGDEENGDLYPACACEWFVIPKEDFDKSTCFEDVLTAAGYTTTRGDSEQESDSEFLG